MGETHVSPEPESDNRHHGESETAIFVRSGNPAFVCHDGPRSPDRHGACDYIVVPPYGLHREGNPDRDHPARIFQSCRISQRLGPTLNPRLTRLQFQRESSSLVLPAESRRADHLR